MEGEGNIRLDHLAHPALCEQLHRGFAQGAHLGGFRSGRGAEQRQARHALGRLARRLHRDHAAHGGAAQQHGPGMGCEHQRGHVFNAQGGGLRVGCGHHRTQFGRHGGELRPPHGGIGREAGDEDQLGRGVGGG